MKKHNLLLSLLALLFAVFMTACNNGSANNAKTPADIGNGGDEGNVVTPSLTISYEVLESYNHIRLTGVLENANAEDYSFMWDYGDANSAPEQGLTVDHLYTADGIYNVQLIATPIDPEKTPELPVAVTTLTISKTGIVAQAFRYSALSGMEYEFLALATTTDGSPLLYTWKVNGEVVHQDTPQNVLTYRFEKYNTEYKVTVSVKKAGEEGNDTVSLDFPNPATIRTPNLTAKMTVENDPEDATLKRMSVNFYDDTGALVHGYSSGTGEVNGLDNVSYKWDYTNDGTIDETTNVRNVEHKFDSGSGEYTIKMTATSDTFAGEISTTGIANIELTYALTGLTARLIDTYGLELQVDISGNGGKALANKSAWYTVTFPDGQSIDVEAVHNGDGIATATANRTLTKYYPAYNIDVKAKESKQEEKILATRSTTVEKPSFRYVLNGPNNGNSYFNKTFSVTPESDSFTLKDANFDWTFGEGKGFTTQVGSASYTYAGPGSKTVTVTIRSDLTEGAGISNIELAKAFTINADVTINSIDCPNNGANTNFLQYNCRVDATGTAGTTLTYKWYKDEQPVSGCAGPYCEHTFDTYNKDHSVKVEVGIEGSNAAPQSTTFPIKTPNVQVTLDGPVNGVEKQNYNYTATTKVRVGNAEKNITLTDANYTFKIAENGGKESQTNNVWTKSFDPGSDFGSGNTVNRTISVDVTGSNLIGTVTSNSITTVIRREESTLNSFNAPVISCTPKSAVNQVRQVCTMTLTVKNGTNVAGNFNEYTGKFIFNDTTYTAVFPEGSITGGTSRTITKEIDFNWPNYGDISTGSAQNQSYNVTGNFYKTGTPNVNTPANNVTVNVNLDVDYVLFPLPSKLYKSNGGGSGYQFGTWSCGYNENYYGRSGNFDSVINNINCASGSSNSGQTLNLGSFANNRTSVKENLKFQWKLRIKKSDGTSIEKTIKTFNVSKGQAPSDADLKFNIADVLTNNERYTGSAYNGRNNVFYLEISSDDANILAKPVRIWYNGSSKTGNGNRLQYITPVGYNSFCKVYIQQSGSIWDYNNLAAKMFLSSATYTLDNDPTTKRNFVPNGNYKPVLSFQRRAQTSTGAYTDYVTDEYTATRVSYDNVWGAFINDSITSQLDLYAFPNIKIGNTLGGGEATMDINLIDMLEGSNNNKIKNYYQKVSCAVDWY